MAFLAIRNVEVQWFLEQATQCLVFDKQSSFQEDANGFEVFLLHIVTRIVRNTKTTTGNELGDDEGDDFWGKLEAVETEERWRHVC